MINLSSTRILVVSRNSDDSAYMQDFFVRIENLPTPDFVVGKPVPADKYDFIVFDARSLPPAPNIEAFTKLPDDIQAHYFLLDDYLRDTTKHRVLWQILPQPQPGTLPFRQLQIHPLRPHPRTY